MMKWHFIRIAYQLVWLCSAAVALDAQTSATADAVSVHIIADVRQLTGDPISGLRSSNFVVLGEGSPLRFRFDSQEAQQPTFLLIVVAPSSGYSSLSDIKAFLSNNVPAMFQTPYFLSVLGPRGESVGFRPSRNALIADLRAETLIYKGFLQAISDLAECRGHRAIIYLTNRLSNPPLDFIAAAKNAGALVYEVGGNPDQNYIYSGEETTGGPLSNYTETSHYGPVTSPGGSFPAVNNTVVWDGSGLRSIRTVYVEQSMDTAFREIAKVLRGSYGLTVDVPQSVRTIELKPKITGDYQLNAFDYTDGREVSPRLLMAK